MRAAIVKAMAHPLRLAIIEFLGEGERCVCEIAAHVGASQPNVSRHLGLMVRAGLLDYRKQGLQVFYRLRTPCVSMFLTCVNRVLSENLRSVQALERKA